MGLNLVKKVSEDLLKRYRAQFTTDFQKNKEILNSVETKLTKAQRNEVAGYIVRLLKRTAEA